MILAHALEATHVLPADWIRHKLTIGEVSEDHNFFYKIVRKTIDMCGMGKEKFPPFQITSPLWGTFNTTIPRTFSVGPGFDFTLFHDRGAYILETQKWAVGDENEPYYRYKSVPADRPQEEIIDTLARHMAQDILYPHIKEIAEGWQRMLEATEAAFSGPEQNPNQGALFRPEQP